jgi:hypothetical protein
MTYTGTVKNGVVELPPDVKIPDGTRVRIEPVDEPPTWGEVFKDLIGSVEGLPSDMARNHDHYLHGAPKR